MGEFEFANAKNASVDVSTMAFVVAYIHAIKTFRGSVYQFSVTTPEDICLIFPSQKMI